ncbi:MAG: LPXTG cell wall anchor domain-containing protein [Thermoanaerobaculia bacterium]
MKRIRIFLAALAVAGAGGAVALAQNADPNTAGPTKNDYRMRVVEPAIGAVVAGPTIRVVVDTRTMPEVGGEKKDTNSMPRPDVKVFLDNEVKGTLKAEQNVLTIDNVPTGDHKLVLVATNRSGEIIDRQEVPFRSEPETTARVAAAPAQAPPAPAPAYREPAPAPARPASPPVSTYETRTTTTRHETTSTLPKTASSDPLLLVGGLALIAAGLYARRPTAA